MYPTMSTAANNHSLLQNIESMSRNNCVQVRLKDVGLHLRTYFIYFIQCMKYVMSCVLSINQRTNKVMNIKPFL